MTLANLMSLLMAGGCSLWAEGEQLRYRGQPHLFSPKIVAEMLRHKPELLSLLRGRANDPTTQFVGCMHTLETLGVGLAQIDHYFERAAIIEFDGGQPRREAEQQAATEALRFAKESKTACSYAAPILFLEGSPASFAAEKGNANGEN